MKRNERIVYLIAAALFVCTGMLQIGKEKELILPILSFIVAGVLFYLAFGKKVVNNCSFSEMKREARKMVIKKPTNLLSKKQALKITAVTFLAVLVSFGMGFGVGKLIYHFTN
ncbi:MAG: hypothetical protein AAGL34_06860 [Bacteroidota bacterium]